MQKAYEAMYIVSPILEDENIDFVINKFNDTVTKFGGGIKNVDKIGRKRLAYKVKKFSEGFYVLTKFTSAPEHITEIDRICKYTDDIIRYIILREEDK